MASTLTASSSTRTRTTATTAEGGGDGGGGPAAARLIDYARRAHAYKLTPAEAEEILQCDYWRGVDDFVTYMRQFAPPPCAASDDDDADAGSGSDGEEARHHPGRAAVNATEDIVVPGLHLYTDAELDAMDAWDGDDNDDDTTEEEDEATDGYADMNSRWVPTITSAAATAAAEVPAPSKPLRGPEPHPRHRSRGPRALARRLALWVSKPRRLPSPGGGGGGGDGRRLLDKARKLSRAWDGLVTKRRGAR